MRGHVSRDCEDGPEPHGNLHRLDTVAEEQAPSPIGPTRPAEQDLPNQALLQKAKVDLEEQDIATGITEPTPIWCLEQTVTAVRALPVAPLRGVPPGGDGREEGGGHGASLLAAGTVTTDGSPSLTSPLAGVPTPRARRAGR